MAVFGEAISMSPEEFLREKQKIKEYEREVATATGRLQQLLQQAADIYNADSLDKLREFASKMDKVADKLEANYEKAKHEWEEEYRDSLKEFGL